MKSTKEKPKTELLAPAKDKKTAFAAIDCGADAVYIGATSFGARKNAPNSLEDIKEVVNYAHKFWAKVYVTVNTILFDNEIDDAVNLVKALDDIGVDAILIQDMGLLLKLKDANLKNVAIHASTQCDNRDIEKIKFFKEIGISRVVLARELSLDKIKEIHEACPEIELEAFVHGALCVSYSGQCYLSHYIGGRSANRGECAQPCRKKYTVKTIDGKIIAKDIYPLCLKDFNASKHLKKMIDNGIFSFKIEGRLKDIGYVKNIVSYYRQELDKISAKTSSGKSESSFSPNPEKSFNRGFTDYFLEKRKDCFNFNSPKSIGEKLGNAVEVKKDYFILETEKNISSQDGLCCFSKNLDGFLVNKAEKISKNRVRVYPNKKMKIDSGATIYRNQDVEFEKQLSLPSKRQIGVEINVTDTNDSLIIYAKDEDGITVSKNIEANEVAKDQQKMDETFVKQISKTGESDFYIKDISINAKIPFMPISQINNLRRDLSEELMNKRKSGYFYEKPVKIVFTKYYKQNLDYHANISNKFAKEFYESCGCKVLEFSPEVEPNKKRRELMRTKHCIKYALNMCKSPQKLLLEDEFGVKFKLDFDCKNCEMVVLPNEEELSK